MCERCVSARREIESLLGATSYSASTTEASDDAGRRRILDTITRAHDEGLEIRIDAIRVLREAGLIQRAEDLVTRTLKELNP